MATLSDLRSKVRLELNDQARQFTKTFTTDGTTKDFNLGVKPVEATTLMVTDNGTPLANPTSYTVEPIYGVIHTVNTLAANRTLKVSGNVFRYFTDDQLDYFINVAVLQHTENRTDGFNRAITIDTLPEIEVYPVVLLSTVEALWALATDAAFDINIQGPDGVAIPRSQRFAQLNSIIEQRKEQYRNICAALNIGIWRIEMGVLRRVSRTTNKLVPVYVSQEIDDSTMPERVYIQRDINGRTPIPSDVPIYDIVLQKGDNFSVILDFPDTFNFNDLVFKAQIRTYPASPSLWATFTITVYDANLRKLQLSLSKEDTVRIPTRCFWDIQATSLSDATFSKTYLRGQIFAYPQVTQ